MKVVWVSTHYNHTIGYSKVTYNILKTLVNYIILDIDNI